MLENKLNELNIFALRDLARRAGVSSPTSKKKEELINGIVAIMSGEKQPDVNRTKQGRPPKVFGYDFSDVLNAKVVPLNQLILNQPTKEYSDEDITTVAGWLEPVNNGAAIMWINKNFKNENYYVSKELFAGRDIRCGDRVVAEIGTKDNQQFVKKIFSVNDVPLLQLNNRVKFEDICHEDLDESLSFEKEEFNSLEIEKGTNVFVYGEDNAENTMAVVGMLNSCKSEHKIYINISLTEKNKTRLQNLKNVEAFVANLCDELDVVRRVILLAVERIKRILEIGESVVVVVDDMQSIYGLEKDGPTLVKNLVSTTKSNIEFGSISLIALMPNNNLVQIEKLADKRLKIINKNVEKI